LIEVLDRHDVKYLIVGGAAAYAYGRLVPYEELVQRATALRGGGFTIRAAALEDIVRAKERSDRPKDREALPELRAIRDARAAGRDPAPGTGPPTNAR
jgi:hypothetical protein